MLKGNKHYGEKTGKGTEGTEGSVVLSEVIRELDF